MKRAMLFLTAAALGLTAAGCGSGAVENTTALTRLHLTDATGSGRAALGAPEPAVSTSPTVPAFVLRTTLPTTAPSSAPVWWLPKARASDAARVAQALLLTATPTPVGGGWVLRSGTQLLAVRTDGSWSWGLDCSPDLPIEQENLDVACATASGGASTGPAGSPVATPSVPPGPSAGQARVIADRILAALGWGDAVVEVTTGAPATTVTARRPVGGADTADWLTSFSVRSGGALDYASGWAVTPTRGNSYPLIDATKAYAMLVKEPRPMPLLCRVPTGGGSGCAPAEPTVVTGASLGLSLRHDESGPVLVPAWLFAVQGSSSPLAVVAVAPRWLAPVATPTVKSR